MENVKLRKSFFHLSELKMNNGGVASYKRTIDSIEWRETERSAIAHNARLDDYAELIARLRFGL